ncbi:MAG: AfsR/SARP family transcriptional regulator [Gemmatimonadales bacterium]
MSLEHGGRVVDRDHFPGSQGCLVFARLALDRHQVVSRDELADTIWPRQPPRAWDADLSAIVSKLRALLARAGLKPFASISSTLGCYQLVLPHDAWIDVEAAADALHQAESALRAGAPKEVFGPANVANVIARRPFLPGEDSPWAEGKREKLGTIFVRSCECLAAFYVWNGEPSLGVEAAKQAVAREPFRESAYRLLMEAHVAAGNRAEALWVYERCRKLLSEELGSDPSPETRAVHLKVLKS